MAKLLCTSCIFGELFLISFCYQLPHFSGRQFLHCPENIDYSNHEEGLKFNSQFNSELDRYRVDWRMKGVMSPVMNQTKNKGSWVFGIIDYLETKVTMFNPTPLTMSKQMLIDCVDQNDGYNKTNIIQKAKRAMAYMIAVSGGLVAEKDYPSVEHKQSCRFDPIKDRSNISISSTLAFIVQLQDFEQLCANLQYLNPLLLGINSASMKKYGKSNHVDRPTKDECSADPSKMDHLVLVVGMDVAVDRDTGEEVLYYIIKNSWGEDWGDKGYYYLASEGNPCGILNYMLDIYIH